MVVERIYLTFSQLFPERFKPGLARSLIQAGIPGDTDIWIGRAMATVALFSLAGFISPFTFLQYDYLVDLGLDALTGQQMVLYVSVPLLLSISALTVFLYYIYLFYRIQNRADTIERYLPDFLLVVVSNLHAGMSPFAAFVGAARPEFGPLEEEVKKVAARASSSQSLTRALIELSDSFSSKIFQKTILFFEKAVRSGGQMAKILHASAEEIRRMQEMREELLSQTKSYVIFLAFMTVMIAPFLMSISGQFLSMFLKIRAETVTGTSNLGMNIPLFQGQVDLTPQFVETAGAGFLVVTSLLISFFMGVIMRGKPLFGIKYFPVLAVASLAVYLVAKAMVSGVLSAFA